MRFSLRPRVRDLTVGLGLAASLLLLAACDGVSEPAPGTDSGPGCSLSTLGDACALATGGPGICACDTFACDCFVEGPPPCTADGDCTTDSCVTNSSCQPPGPGVEYSACYAGAPLMDGDACLAGGVTGCCSGGACM